MKYVFFIVLGFVYSNLFSQDKAKFNLNFEDKLEEKALPEGWFKWGTHKLEVVTTNHSGKYSGKVQSVDGDLDFGCIAYKIPANYEGKTIKLEGFIKTSAVENGFAGLLLRVDGNGESLVFDNMKSQQIDGTRDWEKYAIELAYPKNGENIFVGGILVGEGEAWFDDFVLTIDGKDVQTLKEVEREVSPAQADKEFDKGSGINSIPVSETHVANLELLGRIWGLMKYHHPKVAQGLYNWDYELFRMLPGYLKVKNNKERDRYLIKWMAKYGTLKPCKDCRATDKKAFLKPDLEWIKESNNSANLQQKLLQVYEGRHQGKHYYIQMAQGVGNPEFLNEKSYRHMPYPDAGFRLLAVYKYWNMIHYYFPYKHLMDKNWNTRLKAYIPKFIEAKDELAYELEALQMIGDIQDTHANLWGGNNAIQEWKGTFYPPVHLRFIENQLVVVDYYNAEMIDKVGLKIGTVISKVDGQEIEQLVKENAKYYPASNEPTRLRDMARDLLRSQDTAVEIEYIENGKTQTKNLQLYKLKDLNYYYSYPEPKEKSYKLLSEDIGYITLANIKTEDLANIRTLFEDTDGVVIDIRNYPSTFVPFLLGKYLVHEETPFVKFTTGNVNNPGEFTYSGPLRIPTAGDTYTGKVVVLVNELSQSQAEYTTMAFRAGHNTTIVGSTTAGADGNVSQINLPGGLRTMISGIGVYYPDGKETQRIGIVPDVEVLPTIEGIKTGKDELLEKAIEIIKEG